MDVHVGHVYEAEDNVSIGAAPAPAVLQGLSYGRHGKPYRKGAGIVQRCPLRFFSVMQ